MQPHVHVGIVEALNVCAYVILFTLIWRAAAAKLADKHPEAAKAMAGVYS